MSNSTIYTLSAYTQWFDTTTTTTFGTKTAEIVGMFPEAANYSNSVIFAWLRKAEQICFNEYVKVYDVITADTVANQDYIVVNTGVGYNVKSIADHIIIDGNYYKKIDFRTDPETSNDCEYSFMIASTDSIGDGRTDILIINPTPSAVYEVNIPYYLIPKSDTIETDPDTQEVTTTPNLLAIPDNFNDAYDYYVIGRIKELKQQTDYINWFDRFESRLKDFKYSYRSNEVAKFAKTVTPY